MENNEKNNQQNENGLDELLGNTKKIKIEMPSFIEKQKEEVAAPPANAPGAGVSSLNNQSAIDEVIGMLNDPANMLKAEEKKGIRELTSDTESALKSSLVHLLMDGVNKSKLYDDASRQITSVLMQRASIMAPDELIEMLKVISKISTAEAKGVMDMFKKQDDSFKKMIKDINEDKGEAALTENAKGSPLLGLSPDKADKVLRLMDKLNESKIVDAEDVEESE
jgi:hypothetical protein